MKKYTGKNLEDALNIAASEKQVSVEELTYHIRTVINYCYSFS